MSLFVLLLAGCVCTMVWITATINQSGGEWSSVTEVNLRNKVVVNLQAIADAKGTYVKVCCRLLTVCVFVFKCIYFSRLLYYR
jgi:hypothetical protein